MVGLVCSAAIFFMFLYGMHGSAWHSIAGVGLQLFMLAMQTKRLTQTAFPLVLTIYSTRIIF